MSAPATTSRCSRAAISSWITTACSAASSSASSSGPHRWPVPDKTVKSLHTVFAREGRADEPVRYQATRQHEGRSFAIVDHHCPAASRGVVATSSICMHAVEDGPENQRSPKCLPSSAETHRVDTRPDPLGDPRGRRPQRHHHRPAAVRGVDAHPGRSTPKLAPALAAYATDLTLIGTALRPLDGFNHRGNGTQFTSAVTSHTVWFHRPFRTDGWLLLRQHSPVLAHGRCFGRGDVLTEDGTLVASYAQEALLRFRDGNGTMTKNVRIIAENNIAENRILAEYDSRANGFRVDTRRWLMTELPQVLSATRRPQREATARDVSDCTRRRLLRPVRRRDQRRPVPDVPRGSARRRRCTTTSSTTSTR